MVLDLKIPVTLEELDKMSKDRIMSLMETQSNRLEEREKAEKTRQDKMEKEQKHTEEKHREQQADEPRQLRSRGTIR